ncbi:phage tail sheath subtilisin-like domain-containing protein [Edaphobacter aggregans]|uniref:phage tail sheath family protein n=1 Tax=Edaphobacter aggregans TaxID=570835 RepID=UPI001C8BF156|nr:phage tail sheath subtilisin-like domain-containing protein [Edaphobacter aggregans]
MAPGVYVEEVEFSPNSIGGASTTITGFIGPTLFGPPYGVSELLTSYADFEAIYGGLDPLQFEDAGEETINYLAQNVRAFFQNGGQQIYVVRTFSSVARGMEEEESSQVYQPFGTQCCASATIADTASGSPADSIQLFARYPGSICGDGNLTLTFTVYTTKNVLSGKPHNPLLPSGPKDPVLLGVNNYDTVWIQQNEGSPAMAAIYWAEKYLNPVTQQWDWQFHAEGGGVPLQLSALQPAQTGVTGDVVQVVTVSVTVAFGGAFPRSISYPGLTFHPASPTSLSTFFALKPNSRSQALTVPLVFDPQSQFADGPTIARIMLTQPRSLPEIGRLKRLLNFGPLGSPPAPNLDLSILGTLGYPQLANTDRQFQVALTGGLDGFWPTPRYYEGDDSDPTAKTGLKSFEDLTDISIVAAPGSTAANEDLASDLDMADKLTIAGLLITHCEQMLYRVAVLDSINGQDLTDVAAYRGQLDSKYAALYYPWVRIVDPVSENEINLPPSGFVAGLYVANDIATGVHKAPANMVVDLAIGFELMLNKAQQDVLNPLGINCFRFFEGRGYRLWGARTISSDSQWMYVNVRRYFCYLEHSIDLGTQWVVFEPNNQALWARVAQSASSFLYTEWQAGHLMGTKPEQAYFVRCDQSTMTQYDLDNGRLICLIGVAPVEPAEFVIFRIGQWTASLTS